MPEMKVRLASPLAEHIGVSEIMMEVTASTKLKSLVESVIKRYPKLRDLIGELREGSLLIVHNGILRDLEEDLVLNEGDEILLVIPPYGG